MTAADDSGASEHKSVNRVDQRELVKRLNELERVVPVLRQALEHIADTSDPNSEWGRTATRALRDAQISVS